jgi:hypothetical protein
MGLHSKASMLNRSNRSPQRPLRETLITALGVALIAATLLGRNTVPGESQQQDPPPPHLEVAFLLTLTPDKDAERAGASTLSNQVSMPRGLWFDHFTGAGCISGPFEPSAVTLRWSTEAEAFLFEVTCRIRSKDDATSRMEWKGKLADGKLSGDVWISMRGKPLTAEEIAAKRVDGHQAERDALNEKLREYAGRAADRENALLATQGRRLHFTFTTEQVIITPSGSWDLSKSPATRPTTETSTDKDAARPRR